MKRYVINEITHWITNSIGSSLWAMSRWVSLGTRWRWRRGWWGFITISPIKATWIIITFLKYCIENIVVFYWNISSWYTHLFNYNLLDYIFRFRNAEDSNQLGNVLYMKFLLEGVELLAVDLGFHLEVEYLYQEY